MLLLVTTALVAPTTAAAAPVGSDTVHSQLDSNSAGSAEAFIMVASASASVNRLHVYLEPSSTASEVDLGLYSGSSRPATKLGGCTLSSPDDGWNSCAMTPAVLVTKGTTYWMALLQPRGASGVLRFRDTTSSDGDTSYSSSSSSLSALPDSYEEGESWPSADASLYADSSAGGTGTPPPPPPADRDGDGVPDSSDQCPTQAGPASNQGCPVTPPADGDSDGVPDSSERCPTQAGPASNQGCPISPPAPPPSSGSDCMPNPSACGFPDATNTGVKPGTPLTPASGNVTLNTPGQVYENKTVTGSITVTAANVTIRNVKVTSDGWVIRCRSQEGGCRNLTVEDTEINLDGGLDGWGILDANYTARRLFIHNGSDCAYVQVNAEIHDSFCSVGPDANNDGWADSTSFCRGPEHFDGMQSDGGNHEVYDHNTIRNPCSQTSAILISTNTSPINDVTITNNLLAGGGWTLYCSATAGGVGGTEIVTGNRIARTYRPQGGYYGPVAYCNNVDQWSGNVWDDTGQAIGR